jgi:hypothetical protein
MESILNQQLLSAVYLRETLLDKHPADVLGAARQTILEWREAYPSLSEPADRSAYVKQCLSALAVASAPLAAQPGFTLFADASKERATGLCLLTDEHDLGRAKKGAHPQASLVRALRQHDLSWGIITNGAKWRLCHGGASAPYEYFLEADLDELLRAPGLEEFFLYARFFGEQAFRACGEGIGLDCFRAESERRTEAVEKHLKGRVEFVLQRLCLGFVEDEASGSYSPESLQTVYQNAIYLLYRVLFLFYAEARDLLPMGNERYREASLAAVLDSARAREQDGQSDADPYALWKRLTRLFVIVDDGDSDLGVAAYNGGLFSDTEKPYLKSHRIRDEFLSPALFSLGFEQTKRGYQPIEYRDLSVRHLGTLYEGLLEYRLNRVAGEPRVVRESSGKRLFLPLSEAQPVKKGETILEVGEVYFADDKGERKATGSYYTPEDVVQYIVSNTVGPKLQERRKKLEETLANVDTERQIAPTDERRRQLEHYADQECLREVQEDILSLRILDPAMGSGHFLVAAGQMVTDFIVETLNLTGWPNEEISADPLLWKRRVVERCLYGVDKNPLAQELAKLSLWIASASAGKPLTFLDHHLKVGNSLYGAPLKRLGSLPTAKAQKDDPLFRLVREQVVEGTLKEIGAITNVDSDSIEVVKRKGEANETARNLLERLRAVADVWLASLFDLSAESGEQLSETHYARLLEDITTNYAAESWGTRVAASPTLRAARRIADREQFFHWELEFPDSVVDGESRFDAVTANPPYVGTAPNPAVRHLYATAGCGDIYAWLMEKGLETARQFGNLGFVVPLSLMFSRDFASLRGAILDWDGEARFANFDIRPASLFGTPEAPNSQRATIALLQTRSASSVYTTDLLRWTQSERPRLFDSLVFADVTSIASKKEFPKIGHSSLLGFWHRLRSSHHTVRGLCKTILSESQKDYQATWYLIVPRGVRYYISAFPEHTYKSGVLTLTFESEAARDLVGLVLNSNIFYWYWMAFGDGFHMNVDLVGNFPIPKMPGAEAQALARSLWSAMDECRVSDNAGKTSSYNFNLCMGLLLRIDEFILEHASSPSDITGEMLTRYKGASPAPCNGF